ncbi:DivIVA domain-containing protein [Desertihabitans aurantiacus]|uniref:DivIVA domain-containing protein n=1 Tax=Desertihabitans aurantiacus TaxID=2282477 RepID=UPI000DF86299|nr:DivIVA domain-containing protein [Desertihabitans aurantiacus]
MEWVLLVVAVGVLAVGAVAAAGRFGGMAEEPVRDTFTPALPDRHWSGADLDALRFSTALRGYRMDQVDEVVDRLARELDRRDARIAELEETLARRAPSGPGSQTPPLSQPAPPSQPGLVPQDAERPWR